jgi:hypothetical protein
MIALLFFAVVALAGVVASILEVRRDGFRRVRDRRVVPGADWYAPK